jgi:hypothetical protein
MGSKYHGKISTNTRIIACSELETIVAGEISQNH